VTVQKLSNFLLFLTPLYFCKTSVKLRFLVRFYVHTAVLLRIENFADVTLWFWVCVY